MLNKIGKSLFILFLFLGIISFLFMITSLFNKELLCLLNITNESYPLLASTFILLSSLIAAFSVNRTVINTREMKETDINKERNRNKKILSIGKNILLDELTTQKDFFEYLYNEITNTKENLSEIESKKYFYSDTTNENKIIKQIDYLLNVELHNYSEDDVLTVFFEVKKDVLFIIHYVNVLKNTHIPNNDKNQSLNTINEIFELIDKIETYLKKVNLN